MITAANNSTKNRRKEPVYLAHTLSPNQNSVIVLIHFISMYLEISIYIDGTLIFPYFISTLIAVVGCSLNRSAVKSAHTKYLLLIITLVLLISVVPFIRGNIILTEFLASYAQFIASILSAYCMFIVIILSNPSRLVKYLGVCLLIITIGSFFERFSVVREFSDAFRSMIYPEELLYSADFRDISVYGLVRPRFLTREPSIVGIGAGLLIAMVFLLSRKALGWRVVTAIGVTLVCMWVMRSPTIIFFAAIVCYGALALRPTKDARFSWMIAFVSTLALIAASSLLAYSDSIAGVSNRAIWGGGSYIIRVFGPPLIWLETLRSDALFGLGLGSFEALLPLARKVYGQYDILALFPYFKSEINGSFLISNGFWEYWIFFGLLGGSLIIFFLYRLFRIFGLRYASFPFYASVLSLQTYGGISAYRPWHMIFVFAAIAFWAQRLDTNSDVAQ